MLKVLGWLWALVLLGWIGSLVVEWFFTSDVACPLDPNTSVYGTAQWSWLPPGRVCAWQVPGGTHTDGAPASRVGMLLLFALWGASLLLVRRSKEGTH